MHWNQQIDGSRVFDKLGIYEIKNQSYPKRYVKHFKTLNATKDITNIPQWISDWLKKSFIKFDKQKVYRKIYKS